MTESFWQRYWRCPIIWKVLVGFVTGAVTGLAVGPSIEVVQPLGTLFLRGLIMLSLAITQAGLPMAPVGLVAGIDAVLDMVRTMCNVTDDLVGTQVVARTEPDFVEAPTRAPAEGVGVPS